MKILLTGCNGQVGWEVCRQAPSYRFEMIPTDIHNLDITNLAAIRTLRDRERPDLIINASAYTAVDAAEEQEALALSVNATGPENLATAAAEAGIPIFHISTDYVFSGDATRPYSEADQPHPTGAYGRTKLAGELAVAAGNDHHVTLRTSWVFGIEGNNFVKTMLRLASERDELTVVADQFGTPTFAGHIARALLMLAAQYDRATTLPWGLYNFCDTGPTTWHAFASRIVALGNRYGLIHKLPVVRPLLTSEYPTPATRPAYSVLDCVRFATTFPDIGISAWDSGLQRLLTSMGEQR